MLSMFRPPREQAHLQLGSHALYAAPSGSTKSQMPNQSEEWLGVRHSSARANRVAGKAPGNLLLS